MFSTLLIANRGEIACRIARTCRALGIRSVAVYSDADAEARHVAEADAAIRIGEAPAPRSYLDIEAILAAARAVGAEAVHPGYGFLSESAAFAAACTAAGLAFIGPPAEAIRLVGEKDSAKAAVAAAGVPVLPGSAPGTHDLAGLAAAAERIGWPVLVKPVAGGGGRGLRSAAGPAELPDAIEAARREVRSAFGDDRVLVEKQLAHARHVEVQVVADRLGGLVHLFDRDCSVQRRHQKVIEEAPAPGLDEALRARLHGAALAAARAVGYVGAGTVEFLVAPDGGYHFLEMNARLQVEHPVTEAVTGIDLVEWQIRIAAGERLPAAQDAIRVDGHAIELRLCAEDPARGFAPVTGRVSRLRLPPAIRVDAGIRAGDAITPHYDSMIAKLIAWGPDRQTALRRLEAALGDTLVAGVATNLGWLSAALASPAFREGRADTGFAVELPSGSGTPDPELLGLATLAVLDQRGTGGASPWEAADGWLLNDEPRQEVRFRVGGAPLPVRVQGAPGACVLDLPGGPVEAALLGAERLDGVVRLSIRLGGHRRHILAAVEPGVAVTVVDGGRRARIELEVPMRDGEASAAAGTLASVVPGTVTAVLARAGDTVSRGQALVLVEAMKVEYTIAAPSDGRIAALRVEAGDRVEEGQELVAFEPEVPRPGCEADPGPEER